MKESSITAESRSIAQLQNSLVMFIIKVMYSSVITEKDNVELYNSTGVSSIDERELETISPKRQNDNAIRLGRQKIERKHGIFI